MASKAASEARKTLPAYGAQRIWGKTLGLILSGRCRQVQREDPALRARCVPAAISSQRSLGESVT